MTYKYISIEVKPLPLECILDSKNAEYVAAKKEQDVALSAPELLVALKQALFNLESVAHLRGLEKQLLPFVDVTREKFEYLLK